MKKIIFLLLISTGAFAQIVQPRSTTTFSNVVITGTVSAKNLTEYNVMEYGLKGDNSTDDRAALNTLLNTTAPSGATIYFPKGTNTGTYVIGSAISVTDKYFYFKGDFSTIKINGNFNGLLFASSSSTALAGAKNSFENLLFLGTSGADTQSAITFSTDASEFTVNNCSFTNFGGAGIVVYVTNSSSGAGGTISNCKFFSDGIGIDGRLAGEYVNVNSCYFLSCTQAIQSVAGNWIVSDNNINRCTAGVKWSAGSNDGHSIITNNNINHTGGHAIDISGLANGMTISNNHIYSSNMSITTSTGVVVSGGKLDVGTYTFSDNIGLAFNDVNFVGTSGTANVTGTAPVYNNCKDNSGQILSCPQSSCAITSQIRRVDFALNSSTTLQTFAASSSYYISPLYSTVGSRAIVNQIPYSIGKKCKLIGYSINTNSNSTPTQENCTVYVRINNTTDVTLNSAVQFNSAAWTTNSYGSMALNQDIAATDKFEVKITTGAFVTAPVSAFMSVTLYFSDDF